MIEAGLLMPIFLFMTFAIVDYGLMMSERSAAAGNISSLTRTIQDNPQISIAELNTLIANTGFGNGNLTAAGNCLCAKSFSTQAQAQSFTADTGCGDAACTAAGRNTGIGTPRFIGVRGEVTYNFITPVHNIFTGNNAQVMRFGKVVPVGVTVCPAGQALTSAGVCAASTITCGAGQFLTASGTCSATVPVCSGVGVALQFDGAKFKCEKVQVDLKSIGYTNCYWTQWQNEWDKGHAICPDGYFTQAIDITWWDPHHSNADSIRTNCCQLFLK
jgi:Flp pilus assembly protein TadG